MTPRAIRRAAEHKARKQAAKAARQANAQLSTGPCENFKVLPSENQAAYDQSQAAYCQEWNPETATEHDLVNQLATHAWLRDRAIRLQNNVLAQSGETLGVEDRKQFALFHRYYTTHARAYSRAVSEIMRLKNFKMRQESKEASVQIRFESQKQKTELHTAKIELIEARKDAIKQRKPAAASASSAGISPANQ